MTSQWQERGSRLGSTNVFSKQAVQSLESVAKDMGRNCEVCDKKPLVTAMTYRQERWCSENHRKVVVGELKPTKHQWDNMTQKLFRELDAIWGHTEEN